MDNKEKSPEQELIESIGLMIEKGMESNTNIYTGVVKSVDGKRAVVTVNGQNQNVSIATADVSSGNVVRVFVPEGNMSAAFIIKAEASGGGGTTTTAYGDLTGKPRINGVTLVDNKTSKELNLYGTDNAPPYPVTSVNGQTGDVTISAGGNVDSVNGKTGVVVLNKSDVGLGNVDNVKQYSATNPPPYPVTSVNGAIGEVKSTFYVTVTQKQEGVNRATADKTAEEVYAAYAAGYAVYAIVNIYGFAYQFILPMVIGFKNSDRVFLLFVALTGYEFVAAQYDGSAWLKINGVLASSNDIPTIPEYLPNPYALNIKIGDTTTSYDGIAAKTVEIPEGVPSVTTADNGKFLRVVNGAWAAVAIADASGVKF